jgi:hypothetical protein
MQGLTLRQTLIDHVPARLEKIPSGKAELKTAKIRVVAQARTGTPSRLGGQQPPANCSQLEDKPAMPGYDGDRWVELHAYQHSDGTERIALWKALNGQLLAAARAAPDSACSRTRTIADSKPLTLKFGFEDYIEHMMRHLQHMGIRMDDWQSGK